MYINGQPHTPRDPTDLHHNLNISHSVEEMDNLETYFSHLCKEKAEKNNGTLKVNKATFKFSQLKRSNKYNFQDLNFAENPLEREAEDVDVKLETIFSFQDLYQQMREAGFEGLEARRIPVSEDRAPPEFCFDMMTGERLARLEVALLTLFSQIFSRTSQPASPAYSATSRAGAGPVSA